MSEAHNTPPRMWIEFMKVDGETRLVAWHNSETRDPAAVEYVRAERIAELERRVKENDWAGWERDQMAALFREIGLHPNMELAETLLARRDLRVAADALEDLASDAPAYLEPDCAEAFYRLLNNRAEHLRREAEGVD